MTDKAGFPAETAGKKPVRRISAVIVIAIARRGVEMTLRNAFFTESVKHLFGVVRCDIVYAGVYSGKLAVAFARKRSYIFTDYHTAFSINSRISATHASRSALSSVSMGVCT